MPGDHREILVLDATLLNHSARADSIDLLGSYLENFDCWTTEIVVDELRAGLPHHPSLIRAVETDWIRVDALDTPESLGSYARWTRRVGATERKHRGEASVFACAEVRRGIAITDDWSANGVANTYGIEAHGTLWLLGRLVRRRVMTLAAAESYIEALVAEGARLPCRGTDFAQWCGRNRIVLQP